LKLREHVLHVRHNALNVYEVWILAVLTRPWLLLMLLLLVALAIHVRVSKGLRRISSSCGLCLGSRPSLLLLLRLEISLHEVFIILLPPP
jgi:succinate dehydrogenase hydrophobic anchor subunit